MKTITEAINRGQYAFSPVNMAFVQAMYKKGTGNDKQRKGAALPIKKFRSGNKIMLVFYRVSQKYYTNLINRYSKL